MHRTIAPFALWLCLALLAGCADIPQAEFAHVGSRAQASSPLPPAAGEVLARSARFVIYRPHPDDTLRSIAARFLDTPERDWVIAEFNHVTRAEAGKTLVVPLTPVNPTGVYSDELQTVQILCYHRFGGNGGKMSVSPGNFAAQLDWLARNGYRVIRLEQLLDYLEGRQPLPRRSVVITIDDGYESVYRQAFPLLRRYGFPATLFVYPDFIGAGDALSWPQLSEMVQSGLIDVQPHSKTHRNLIERFAGETDDRYRDGIEHEVRAPRELLERQLKVRVRHFAYPFGDANELVLDTLSRHRYQLAVTVHPGGNAFYAQPFMLRRTMIFGDHDLDAFKARVQTSRPLVAAP